jgi:glycosyltransferase involved in cell wall biosynthesis
MTDLSVIIPARNEEFLSETIDNVIDNFRGNSEIVIILDGYWPHKPIPQHEKVNILHYEKSIGQRAAVNKGAQFSNAKFIMKLDAHCAVDKGFDVKLMTDCEYDWTIVPAMYNLHAFDWVCKYCGYRVYQGPYPNTCGQCDARDTDMFEKKIVWHAKHNPRTEFCRFDRNMKFAYWRRFKRRKQARGDLAPTLGNLGACFFMHRDRFFDLGGMDEAHGGWGQFGTEISCKSWLSGGKQLVNKKTWFAHMFRTGGGFGFPYKISGKDQRKARNYSKNLWLTNSWPGAKHDLKWLIEKFHPVPEWEDYIKGDNADRGVKAKPVKGCVYYTHHKCNEIILDTVRNQLKKICNGMPITSVSLLPLDFGDNITVDLQPSVLTMFKQILKGLETIKADVVYLTEHDVIYHPSHFDFTPSKTDVFYYNQNVWHLNAKNGQALYYITKQTSGVCGYKDMMIDHYRNRVKRVEEEGFTRRMGFEPGTHKFPRGFDYYTSDVYMSEHPNIDIRHRTSLTGSRFKKEQFRRQPKGWNLADEIPFWGKTKGCFDQFLASINNAV